MFEYLAEISGLGMLGKKNEATEALERLKKVQPDISISFVAESMPIVESEVRDHFLHGLEIAGMNPNRP